MIGIYKENLNLSYSYIQGQVEKLQNSRLYQSAFSRETEAINCTHALSRARSLSLSIYIYVYLLYIYIYNPIVCVYTYTQIHTYRDFNELVQLIMRAGKHKICRAVRQARNSCRTSGYNLEAEFLLQQTSVFAFISL